MLAFARVADIAAGAEMIVDIAAAADDLAYYGDDLTLQVRMVCVRVS